MKRLLSTMFWSVIAAAFIGPGTVTTAASAGAGFAYALLWALLFSTAATLVLQEAAARLTIVSGLDLAQALRRQYHGGLHGAVILLLVLGAIVFGCAAYEAGNILGGVAGAALGTDLPRQVLTLAIGALAGAILWFGSGRAVAYALSVAVAGMGVAFLVTAVALCPPVTALLQGSLVPILPPGSELLALALVGTTVVPYNLFLGSGLAAGRDLALTRFGLTVAIALGGLISMAVIVVGAAVVGPFSYEALADALVSRLGEGGRAMLAFGLFAAGFSSAVTAPFAAAVTTRGLFGGAGDARWRETGWRYRLVWAGVLATGVAFGLADVRPIPAIILAQALNGIVLPLAAVVLLLAVNDARLMGAARINGVLANVAMSVVVAVALTLGAASVLRAAAVAFGLPVPGVGFVLGFTGICCAVLAPPLLRTLARGRRVQAPGGSLP